jgi:hypothetical protein
MGTSITGNGRNPVSDPDIGEVCRAGLGRNRGDAHAMTVPTPTRARRWRMPGSENALRRGCGRLRD